MKFQLCSTCDDAGNVLAQRMDDAYFVRVVSEHDAENDAENAKKELLRHYKNSHIAIGEGCLLVRETEE